MHITDQEKQQLRHKVLQSVSRYIRHKRYLRYGLGLAATGIIALMVFLEPNGKAHQESLLDNYVKTKMQEEIPDHIQLRLNGGQNVRIAETNASIAYSNTGEQVTIGNHKSVSQKTQNDQNIIFNTLIVPYGKRSSIVLADGSKVWLNSGSKLIFPAVFTQEKREVYLEGEGIFEVAHNKAHPFVVKSGDQTIEVLGTVFNLSNYHDDETIATVLKSGSVRISYDDPKSKHATESITITPNTMAVYHRGEKQMETDRVEVEKYFSWRDGIFIFKNDSMQSIMKKIARYYNIEIVIRDSVLAQTTFSGYLDVKDNVQNVMKTLHETTAFDYTIENNKLIIN